MIANRAAIIFITVVSLVFMPGVLNGQDISASGEDDRAVVDALIQDDFQPDQSDQFSAQSLSSEPLLKHASYTNKNISVTTIDSRATDFRPNGSRFYVLGRGSLNIAEYQLSTSWDIETASYVRELDISTEMGTGAQNESVPNGIYIKKNGGDMMWVFNRTEIWEYTLQTAWDVSSAVQTGYQDLSGNIDRGHDIDFKPDGTVLYVDDREKEAVFHYNLSTPWDIETATLDYAFDISSEQNEVRGIQLSPDGDRMFLMDTGWQEILEYSVSTPYSLQTASFLDDFSVSSQSSNPRGLTFNPDFSGFYVTSASSNQVYQYKISIVDPENSSLASSRNKVIANGTATSRITVTVRDQDGDRMQGVRVTLNSNSSNVSTQTINRDTNSNGQARFDVSNSVVEDVTFHASAMGETIDETVTVRFVGLDSEESAIASSRSKVIANGTGTSRITVTARDEDGDELEGVRITLNSNSGNVSIQNVNRDTNSNGEARFDVSNTVNEAVTFSASGMGETIDETVTVRFVGVDADESSITSNREKVLANGTASGTITVIARDEDGDELQDVEISLTPNGGSSTITDVQNVTDSDGRAVFRVSNDVSEQVVYSASGLNTTLSESVLVNFVTVNPALSSVSVSPESVQANGEDKSTITVTTRDDDGDLLQGAVVELEENGSSSTIEVVQDVTDSNGEALFRVSSGTPSVMSYTVIAEGIELDEPAEVKFIPIAPVALSATEVQTRQFTSNWELVEGADSYLIDVATDSSFTDFVPGHQNRNVGQQTSFVVEGVNPGTKYMYRVRAQSDGLVGENSQIISTTTFPDTPVATEPTNRSALQFTANWQPAEGAKNYRLDVARDENFENYVEGYEDSELGQDTFSQITGLEPGTTYFYRVRAEAPPRQSGSSNVIETSTLSINPDNSQITSSQLRVLANGSQENEITIIVKSDEGINLEGVGVSLHQQDGNSQVNEVQSTTDEDGRALFTVTNTTAEKVTYNVEAANVILGELSVEFLQDDGVLNLGNNYPNPFNSQTIIPLTIPRQMQVRITIYNSLGSPIRVLVDEEMPPGHYEIPFHGGDVASGVYFYRLVTPDVTRTEKMLYVK